MLTTHSLYMEIRANLKALLSILLLISIFGQSQAQGQDKDQEWNTYGGDLASTRYSPLDTINAENFNELELAWEFDTSNFGRSPEFNFQSTPLMVNRTIYTTAGSRRDVVALDAQTGEILWMSRLDEGDRASNAPRRLSGRGLAWWDDGSEAGRIIYVTPGYQMIALDAASGERIENFGLDGIVDLKQEFDQSLDLTTGEAGLHAAPIVANGVVVIGTAFRAGRMPTSREKPKGHVRGYDARTGNRLWIFHTIAQADEYGNDTWLNNSWTYTGYGGVWAQMTIDPELNMVYLPTETATGDSYGGHRHGDNLFTNSVVALDLTTGARQWHFQTIHHDVWDWDIPAAPILLDLTVNGRTRAALAQPVKQGFTFVFDRATGEPLFEIEEVPVPPSDVPGERLSPTQPIPVKPPSFARQGLNDDELIDFTPELKAKAREILSQYRYGDIYSPPSLAEADDGTFGTLFMPSQTGGANWPGGAADPETGIMYIFSKSDVGNLSMSSRPDRSDMDYINLQSRNAPRYFVDGLPLIKPPYGQIVALDLNEGEILWDAVHGETPDSIRNHPALAGLDIPPTGQAGRVGVLVTKTLVIAGDGGPYTNADGEQEAMLRAYDKLTGEQLGSLPMPAQQTGSPMTYAIDGVQYLAVAISGGDVPGQLRVYSYEP
jgi:quinoprotein glucose dehydrogenase